MGPGSVPAQSDVRLHRSQHETSSGDVGGPNPPMHLAEPAQWMAFGSNASRSASPRRLNETTSTTSTVPGMNRYVGTTSKYATEFASIAPKVVSGGTTPTPRNDRGASRPT